MSEEMDYESEAAKQGWVPQEEWRGDESKWTDAETFVKNGEKIAGIATKRAKSLENEVETLASKVRSMEETNRQFGEYHRKALEKAEQEKAEAIAELQRQKAEAITNGDGEEYLRTEQQIANLQRQNLGSNGRPAYASEWEQDNPWYLQDDILQTYALGMADKLRAEDSTLVGRAFMDEVSKRTKAAFPDKFKNPRKGESQTSGTGSIEGESAPKDRTYSALPAEHKAICDRFIADGLIKDRAEYIKEYDFDQE